MDLFKAAKNGNINRINELLDNGVNINIQDGGSTPLMFATGHSNTTSSLDTVKLLLDRGADINHQNMYGWTPLMHASRYSNTDSSINTVKLLLDRGANINIQNSSGRTALMFATGESNHDSSLDTAKLLLNEGADVNIQDNIGNTALIYASKLSNKQSSIETVSLLLEYGADPFILNNDRESAIDVCPTDECKKMISIAIWKRLYDRDMSMAKRYSESGDIKFPKDIWELILLNKRQQQLCKDLSSDKNKDILLLFALELGIPIDKNITKGKLCGIISRQLAYGKYYSDASKKYTDKKLREDVINIKNIAIRFGIDPNKPIDKILYDIAELMK